MLVTARKVSTGSPRLAEIVNSYSTETGRILALITVVSVITELRDRSTNTWPMQRAASIQTIFKSRIENLYSLATVYFIAICNCNVKKM